jgi:hypothetical protein
MTIILVVSICGKKSIGNFSNEKIPNIDIATKISIVVIGLFTDDL